MEEENNDVREMISEIERAYGEAKKLIKSEYGRGVNFELIKSLLSRNSTCSLEFREPDIQIEERGEEGFKILLDMPGISSGEIIVLGVGKEIIVLGGINEIRYYKDIILPVKINRISWNYSNGTLRIDVN